MSDDTGFRATNLAVHLEGPVDPRMQRTFTLRDLSQRNVTVVVSGGNNVNLDGSFEFVSAVDTEMPPLKIGDDGEPRWKRLERLSDQGMAPDEYGQYVRFEDAKAVIEELEEELQEARWAAMGEDL